MSDKILRGSREHYLLLAPLMVSTTLEFLMKTNVGLIRRYTIQYSAATTNGLAVEYSHRLHPIMSSHIPHSVNITLEEVDVRVLFREGLEGGCNHMAWTAPTRASTCYFMIASAQAIVGCAPCCMEVNDR